MGEVDTRVDERAWLSTVSLLVLATVATAGALFYTSAVMVPFVLALFLSYLVSPIVDGMQTMARVPRALSIFVALLIVVGLLTLLGMLVTVSTRGIVDSAPIYRERLAGLVESVLSILDRFQVDLGQEAILDGVKQLPLLSMIRSTAGTVVSLFTNGFLVMIFTVFLLAGREPHKRREGIFLEIDRKIRRYVVVKVTTSAITGVLVGSLLTVLGLELALVFGILAFFLNFIPNVGSIIATLLPLPVAFVQFDSLGRIGLILLLPGSVQITVGNFLEPKLMGEGLELHPVSILIGLVFWGLIWGVVGMLLAAPIMAIVQIVSGRFLTTKPIADLLAGRLESVAPPEEA